MLVAEILQLKHLKELKYKKKVGVEAAVKMEVLKELGSFILTVNTG